MQNTGGTPPARVKHFFFNNKRLHHSGRGAQFLCCSSLHRFHLSLTHKHDEPS